MNLNKNLRYTQNFLNWFVEERPVPNWNSLVFFTIFSLILNFDKIILGPGAAVRFHDTFEADFPRILNIARDLQAYGLSEWYGGALGGMPVNAYHFTSAHPLVLLSLFLAPWMIYHGIVITYCALAGYGFYRFIRTFFSLTHVDSVVGGIIYVFACSFFFYSIILVPLTYLFPLLFALLHGDLGKKRIRSSFIDGLALAVLTLFSYPINAL